MTVVADVIRVACLLAAIFTGAGSLRAVIKGRCKSKGQKYRFISFGIICFTLAFSNYHHLGDSTPYWPILIANVVGLYIAILGIWPVVFTNKDSDDDSLD